MSIWIKAEMNRNCNRKCFKLFEADAIDYLNVDVNVGNVDATVDRLKAMGLIPKDAYLYSYQLSPLECVHQLYMMHPSFPEVKLGDMVTPEILDLRKIVKK